MNSLWVRLRLVLLIAGIFVLGAAAGHLATKRWQSPMAEDSPPSSASAAAEDSGDRRQIIRATRKVMEQYRATLSLTDDQMEKVKPMFVSAGLEMGNLSKDSPLRFGVIANLHEAMRPLLNPHQRELCEEILAKARQNHNQPIPTGAP